MNGSRQLETLMYIDSGADITTIPLEAGRALGLKQSARDKITEMRGVSGSGVPYIIKTIRILINGFNVRTRIAWTLIEEVPFLLGRLDIFKKFEITFQEYRQTIKFCSIQDLTP